jgi:hemoglobin
MIRPHHLCLAAWLLAMFIALPARAEDTLYQRLGEKPGITRIIEETIRLIMQDDRVKDDFDNINLDRLRGRLVDQICQLAHGPCVYKGQPMGPAHNGLDVTQAKFNAVAEDLQTAMEHTGIPYRTQNRLMALLAPMEREIVTR